jgi:hypothetical protein
MHGFTIPSLVHNGLIKKQQKNVLCSKPFIRRLSYSCVHHLFVLTYYISWFRPVTLRRR